MWTHECGIYWHDQFIFWKKRVLRLCFLLAFIEIAVRKLVRRMFGRKRQVSIKQHNWFFQISRDSLLSQNSWYYSLALFIVILKNMLWDLSNLIHNETVLRVSLQCKSLYVQWTMVYPNSLSFKYLNTNSWQLI